VKFFFLQRKTAKVIHAEITGVLAEAAASLVTVKHYSRHFKQGGFCLDEKFRPRSPLSDMSEAVSQFISKEPFFLHAASRRG
jgi:hypothetical protein